MFILFETLDFPSVPPECLSNREPSRTCYSGLYGVFTSRGPNAASPPPAHPFRLISV